MHKKKKTLAQSNINGVDVFLFEVFEPKVYTYIGQVKLAGKPYQEQQPDINDKLRLVWVFPLQLINENPTALPETLLNKKQEYKEKEAKKLSDLELEKRAKYSKKRVGTRQVQTTSYERNVYVAEFAKRRARGICQLCEKPAPFSDSKGNPYLETHHIEWISYGGDDSIENTVALCPNCHRKMHVLNLKADKEKLKRKANEDN